MELIAKLTFNHAPMGAGKSIELLKIAFNFNKQGKKVWLLTSSTDDRDGVGNISSRIGLSQPAVAVRASQSVLTLFENTKEHFDAILVDEAQFFTADHIKQMATIADLYDVPIFCFGLKNTFSNELFEGSQALLIHADTLVEIKTSCSKCIKKATHNLRLIDDKPVYKGETIQIGGDESYMPVCRKHYYRPNE